MKTLILTEKREAAFQVASTLGDSILGCDMTKLDSVSKSKGFLEGEKYLFCWASGHLFTQIKPADINPAYQLFKPFINKDDYKMPNLLNEIKSVPSKEQNKQRQIKLLKELFARKDIEEIIVMTDADEEGEAIGRDMLFKITKKLPTTNITRALNTGSFKSKEAVEKALNERGKLDSPKYNNLYDAQRARSDGDYITGMKITKALVDTYLQKLYTGRVKAVVTGLIGDRENEIKNFVPKNFYTLIGKKGNIELKHFYYEETEDENDNTTKAKQERYTQENTINEVIQKINDANKTGIIEEYKQEVTTTKNRPLPLSGTDFASEMMGKYKIKYKECNEILDYLRSEGFTTYPGTNGRYFSKNDATEVQSAFLSAKKYFGIQEAEYVATAGLFDDIKASKQNHTPLSITAKVPTQRDIEDWSKHKLPKLKEAYELIAKRILVHFLQDDKIEKQTLIINVNGALFFVSGQKALNQGWRSVVDMEIKNTLFNIDVKQGDTISLDTIEKKVGQTKCPALFNEKTLVDIMLNISRVVDEMIKEETDGEKIKQLKKDKKLLKEAQGIGTDRTREAIISDLISEKLVINTKDGLILSDAGKIIYDVLPKQLKNPIMTAVWENYFEEIRRGETALATVLSHMDTILMNEMIPEIINNPKKEYIMNETKKIEDVKCPLCGGDLIETPKTYKCENQKWDNTTKQSSGCAFNIFKDQNKFFGRKLTGKDLPALFASTKENPYKENKSGIYLDITNKYFISPAFNDKKPQEANTLIETPKTYRYNDQFLYKNCYLKDLTREEAQKLFAGQIVTLKRESKDGKEYEVKVKYNSDAPGSVLKV